MTFAVLGSREMSLKAQAVALALTLAACSNTTSEGPCPIGQVPSQQIVVTETPCDLSGPPAQCAELCDADCEEGNFNLGAVGSGCARTPDGGELCRCVCAECRLK